ncbi:hypothetical protein MYX76_13200 [Desulfobacterota bacterium AH_259_B03_O07]|nr:hypothetical protein [Desulfobacterota bacterium AH_259_B03_O07]
MRLNCIWLSCLLMVSVLLGSSAHADPVVPFVPNDIMTTPFGPAFADIVLERENFLPCLGGPFALCYYSGPEPKTCELIQDGTFANCKCFEIAYGPYFVLIHGILNTKVYLETVEECGMDGSKCQDTNTAPVCDSINRGEFISGADMISTFSFDCAFIEGIGCTNCQQQPPLLYGGCMTAPCVNTDEEGIVLCSCPTFDGPFQVGQFNQACDLGGNLVWSAAFNPNADCEIPGKGTFPPPPPMGCIPAVPVDLGGCPLLSQPIPTPPPNVDCDKVCEEYQMCQGEGGVEIVYTCDATLCTSTCNDRFLVGEACSGLPACDVSETAKAEKEAGCSCCASQICGCDPNATTNEAIFDLNKQQRERGIKPQCDINDTLCGEESPGVGSSGCSLASIGTKPSFPLYILIPALILIRRFWRIYKS